MQKLKRLLVAAIAGVGVFSLAHGQALACEEEPEHLACYKYDDTPFRIELDVKYHSHLKEGPIEIAEEVEEETAEDRSYGRTHQKAYSVHGKVINGCYYHSMSPATGTIVTSDSDRSSPISTGAHLTLRDNMVRPTCVPTSIDCTTSETSKLPKYWKCFARSDAGKTWYFTLTKTDASRDRYCRIFEDSYPPAVMEAPTPAFNRVDPVTLQ